MYLEHALRRTCNLITIYVDQSSLLYYLGSHWLPPTLTKKPVRLITRHLLGNTQIDLLLVVDPIRFDLTGTDWGCPTAYYAIDYHVGFKEHVERAKVADYDFVFVAQKDSMDSYAKAGCKRVSWLPPAADPEIHRRFNSHPIYDVCFVGNLWPGRREFIEALQLSCKNLSWYVGRQHLHNMSAIYGASNIVLNKSLRGDLNMRVFESMACGRLLVTDRIHNGFDLLFKDGQELITYTDVEEAARLIQYYSAHREERETIASRGFESILRAHTYNHRGMQILETAGLRSRLVAT